MLLRNRLCTASRPATRPAQRRGVVARAATKQRVQDLLAAGHDLYNPGDLKAAVDELLLSCPIPKEQLATQSFILGQGTWQVFWGPHFTAMSSVLTTKFAPITYRLEGTKLTSHVKWSSPVLGSGWLSAAGTMARKYDSTVEVKFDQFWVDGPDELRTTLLPGADSNLNLDGIVGLLGKAAFIPQLALFPVHWLDEDMCVFEFPPLNSKIGCVKIATNQPRALTSDDE